ncbi:hypothetical protein FLM48_06235 [Shewanella sp. Scap07]|uniref:hypothetical protein n=1 Tax=Shewanella sp. Scap07 TaxID=2589987 RepID=UPI0015BBA5BE|nr:hypothetical protein [Shewanella sp. Scap07]QLE84723.1 hypothetical protein FLM48_06235 [Shewanella sp. Scap07]
MKNLTIILIWSSVLLLVLLGLRYSWQSTFTLSESKVALISKWITAATHQQSEELQEANLKVVIIGTSLTQAGFDTTKNTSEQLSTPNHKLALSKITVGAAAATELEAVLIHALALKPDLILIEINPWTLSFGGGHHFSLHRLWLATMVQQGAGFIPIRFHQSEPSSRSEVFVKANPAGMQKFQGFMPTNRPFSSLAIQALASRTDQIDIKFFYPGMASELASRKGKAWQVALEKAHEKISRQTGISLLPAINNLSYQNYTDLVHVNRQGAQVYMDWLETVISEYR